MSEHLTTEMEAEMHAALVRFALSTVEQSPDMPGRAWRLVARVLAGEVEQLRQAAQRVLTSADAGRETDWYTVTANGEGDPSDVTLVGDLAIEHLRRTLGGGS